MMLLPLLMLPSKDEYLRWTLLLELPRICEALGSSFHEDAVGLAHEALFEHDEFLLAAAIECVDYLLQSGVYKNVRASFDIHPFDFLLFHPAASIRRSMLRMISNAERLSNSGHENIWGRHSIDDLATTVKAVANYLDDNSDECADRFGAPVAFKLYEAALHELAESSEYCIIDHGCKLPVLDYYAENIPKNLAFKENFDSSGYSLQSKGLFVYMEKVAIKLSRMSVDRVETEEYVGGGYFRVADDF